MTTHEFWHLYFDIVAAGYGSEIDGAESVQQTLPWIGPITCYHLAKNYGHDCAKPDRHLVRIAARSGETVNDLCARLAKETGLRVATVDLVLWRAANLGLI